ncbi:hypothetical protein ACWFMI_15855 [Nocardiopsis terrae]
MSHPRPSGHPCLPPAGKLPLLLGAAAVSLTLVGCSYLPESLGGSATEGGAEERTEETGQTEEAPHDPADAESSIRTAVEHVETADDYETFVRLEHESGDPFKARGGRQRYTSTPEEVVYSQLGGEGMLNAVYYTNSEHTLWAIGDGLLAEVAGSTPADEFMADSAVGAAGLSQILATSTDLVHGGEGEVDLDYPARNEDGGHDSVQETLPAHSYSGTFTSTVPEFVASGDAYALELAEYPDSPFTLWLDEEGVPVLLEHTSGEYTHSLTFVSFNEGLELTMPAPGDPANP